MQKRLTLALVSIIAYAAGAASAESAKVKISGRDCKRLMDHQAKADATYRPGVDAHGRKVVGADLPGSGSNIKLPSTIEFDMALNPLKGDAKTRFGETSAGVGHVKFDLGSNSVTFNGQPLDSNEVAELTRKCRAMAR